MVRKTTRFLGGFLIFVVTGAVWAGLVRWVGPGSLRDVVMVAFGFAFAAAYLSLLVRRVRGLLGREGRVPLQLGLALLEVLLMVSTFALVYSTIGLLDNTALEPSVVHSLPLSLYYSVVTFTTLGYGDFYPVGAGRALAAAEAAIGYFILGVLASTAASLLSPHSPAGGLDDSTEREPNEPR